MVIIRRSLYIITTFIKLTLSTNNPKSMTPFPSLCILISKRIGLKLQITFTVHQLTVLFSHNILREVPDKEMEDGSVRITFYTHSIVYFS